MKPAEASLPSDTEVRVKRSFDAPVKLVWRAYMEPDLMRRWCSGYPGWSMPVCEMDMRVGGKYRWRWCSDENGQEFGFTGEVLEVTPHAKIVHTQIYDVGDLGGADSSGAVIPDSMGSEPSIITVTFQETNGITDVTTTIRFASQVDRDAALETGMSDGMEFSYQQLDRVLGEM
ncbi:MAG TPA: SRPBCC family protein [Pirellulaceae bacterium]|nr:SRPBCC family protein [Pirellulaceae bacterium]HMO94224.1 SRPBCC family protein [Pirellulaceae bacterium]HMP71335.1 SRPBCC family protein [Pirellulaceae bacterium]